MKFFEGIPYDLEATKKRCQDRLILFRSKIKTTKQVLIIFEQHDMKLKEPSDLF